MRLIDAEFEENHYASMLLNPTPDVTEQDKRKARVIIEALRMAKTVEPEPHWIPVTERLPEVSGCYLVSVKNDHKRRYSKTAWFEKSAWFARQDVIAWCELPEPYKEVTE